MRGAETFPRLFEIYSTSDQASPGNWFQQPNVWRGLLDNSPGLQPIEDDLQVLDPAPWAVFHVKAARLVHLMDKWGYSRALFDCFNEIKGYRYLVQAGYRDVRFVPEQQETQTPDLRARSEESTVLMVMFVNTIVTSVVICSTVLSAFFAYVAPALAGPPDKLEAEYYRRLDDWVARGGPIPEIQDTVVQTCGKLVMWTATTTEKLAFTTTRRDDFDFRVDICVKLTVNRVHPQPEFEKPHLVKMICDEGSIRVFVALCERSGLRQAKSTEARELELVSKSDAVRLFATPRPEWEKNINAAVTAGRATRLSPSSSGFVGMAVKTDSGYLMTRLSYAKGDARPDVIQLVVGYRPGQPRFTDAQAQQVIAAVQRQLAPEFEVTGNFERPEGGSAFFFFISEKK